MRRIFSTLVVWFSLCAVSFAQDPKIALDPASPSTAGGVSSADVLVAGPAIYTSASSLGLVSGSDFLNDISYGQEALMGPLYFSVDRIAVGLAGSAVYNDALTGSAAPNVYQALPPYNTNTEIYSGISLGLQTGLFGDAITAIGMGTPMPYTYFALNSGSASISPGGASSIYVSDGSGSFSVFASSSQIGISSGDEIDGLALFDANLNGTIDSGDYALFSLTAFSPSVFTSYAPGDILLTDFSGNVSIYASAASLGLRPDDEVTAIQLRPVPQPTSLALLFVGGVFASSRIRRRPRPISTH